MAYETKVILSLLSSEIAKSDTVEEAYNAVVTAANVEGLKLPDYTEKLSEIQKLKSPKKK